MLRRPLRPGIVPSSIFFRAVSLGLVILLTRIGSAQQADEWEPLATSAGRCQEVWNKFQKTGALPLSSHLKDAVGGVLRIELGGRLRAILDVKGQTVRDYSCGWAGDPSPLLVVAGIGEARMPHRVELRRIQDDGTIVTTTYLANRTGQWVRRFSTWDGCGRRDDRHIYLKEEERRLVGGKWASHLVSESDVGCVQGMKAVH